MLTPVYLAISYRPIDAVYACVQSETRSGQKCSKRKYKLLQWEAASPRAAPCEQRWVHRLQRTSQGMPTAQSRRGCGPPSNAWFSGSHDSTVQTASWSAQPFSQGSTMCPTDRPTDHATSATIGRILCSTRKQPNNSPCQLAHKDCQLAERMSEILS